MGGDVSTISKTVAEAVLRDRRRVAAVDIPPTVSDALDAWIADQPDPKPTRPEVIREALTEHLKAKGYLK
jgi:hypothetical protein